MNKFLKSYSPGLHRFRGLIRCMAVLFMLALGSSLISLPFSSRANRAVLLNTVEEEAGSTNNFNEEHKNGKSMHCQILDHAAFLALNKRQSAPYEIPRSVDILSSLHSKRIIQPPES